MKFIKEIEAIQYTGDNAEEVRRFFGPKEGHSCFVTYSYITDEPAVGMCDQIPKGEENKYNYIPCITIDTMGIGKYVTYNVNEGDWVVKDNDEFYPIKPEVFEKTYKPMEVK